MPAEELDPNLRLINAALRSSPGVEGGLISRAGTWGVVQGPSGGSEILCLLHAEGPPTGYWYGHISFDGEAWVSCLANMTAYVNAQEIPLLFKRYWYWARERRSVSPATIQSSDDAYFSAASFDEAVSALIKMIRLFDVRKRAPLKGTDPYNDNEDLRICRRYNAPPDAPVGLLSRPPSRDE